MKGNRGNPTPAARRKSGANYNPHGWGGGAPFPLGRTQVGAVTAFEEFVSQLGVPEQFWPEEPAIRKWVHRNKNLRYIPESLLVALGERVNTDTWAV